MSNDPASEGHQQRRADRVALRTDITLRKRGYNPSKVELLDVSTLGCRVETMDRLTVGEDVWLRLPTLESIHAKVAWTQEWTAGLQFGSPIHPAVFEFLISKLRK